MLKIKMGDNSIQIGSHFSVNFQRTLRIPDDGKTYPLPPGLGSFPVFKVSDYKNKVPASWVEHGGVFIPMYQKEALWLSFGGAHWRPNAVKIGVGKVNAISGNEWNEKLSKDENDYIVCPEQPWLDGINAGDGYIRQFVAMPLGMGYTVEGQVTGKEEFGGIQIIVYDPKPGIFPDKAPYTEEIRSYTVCESPVPTCYKGEMGLAAVRLKPFLPCRRVSFKAVSGLSKTIAPLLPWRVPANTGFPCLIVLRTTLPHIHACAMCQCCS